MNGGGEPASDGAHSLPNVCVCVCVCMVQVLIAGSSLVLALQNPGMDHESDLYKVLHMVKTYTHTHKYIQPTRRNVHLLAKDMYDRCNMMQLCVRVHVCVCVHICVYVVCLQFDIVFTAFFAVEMVLKIVTKGMVLHRGAYWRSGWDM